MTQSISGFIQKSDISKPIVNKFCITLSTINGSGSNTANTILLRSIFNMGIPVAGKNTFPSNIQGLPTWYSIRVSDKGHQGRLEKDDIVVAMNAETIDYELEYVVPGGVVYYADHIPPPMQRDDIVTYPMPVKSIVKEAEVHPTFRNYAANMVYLGCLSTMLGIHSETLMEILSQQFEGKRNALEVNQRVINLAIGWSEENLEKTDPYMLKPMDSTRGYVLTNGNNAAALGAVYGGAQFVGWYPITPATSVIESLKKYMPMLRKDPISHKNTYAIIQAEDEIAAIGMVVGAGWAGLRSLTVTSGPGLSLMAEYLGLAFFAEVPMVVWDVQRVGPSTGLPTRTSQGDLTFSYFIGHGDTQYIILVPGSVEECYEFCWRAFDLAERFQTPVIILSDLDLGMNHWMVKRFEYPDAPMDRGKVLWEQGLDKMLNRTEGNWGRYMDVDGDGIPYRTLPGNRHPSSAYFTRGTGHDEFASYREDPKSWGKLLMRVKRKFETAKSYIPEASVSDMEGATIGIISAGSTNSPIEEARENLAKVGIATNYLRIRGIPFTAVVDEFMNENDHSYIIEMNHDGQLKQLLTMEFPYHAKDLIQLSCLDGLPISACWVMEEILKREEAAE
jgi:2-oxoglutarate/2-oxoacid ferredoxin oxidoreductase subunit alpha